MVFGRVRHYASAAGAVAALMLGACAGGGDLSLNQAGLGGPAAPKRVPVPSTRSGEYRRSWGLALVDAFPAYAAGATGRGVTVALIDVGLEGAQPEVIANLSDASTDLEPARDPSHPPSRHGGYVAGTLASALNGGGVVGVAYEVTVLSIRVDVDGRCDGDHCAVLAADLRRGIDYALDHGARVIALALQGEHRLGPEFEAALGRAKAAGAVLVAAAGNDASAEPAWPARYAADPRFAGAVIAVGAVDADARAPSWSNRAGGTADHFLLAPGRRVVTDCDQKFCRLVSGTSFAVPYVAGALALVMEAHPSLTAQAAGAMVLEGARDMGAKGTDPVFGRGLLDIGRAMQLARRPPEAPRL